MKRRIALASSLVAAVLIAAAADGCGSDVATCESICALPGAAAATPLDPNGCAAACTAEEAACASAGYAANFQLYLTCVGNVGSFADVQQNVASTNPTQPAHYTTVLTACAAEAAALANECGAGNGTGTGFTSSGYNGWAPPGGSIAGSGSGS